jgi:uncharacterized protein YecT (DUF1311 family)
MRHPTCKAYAWGIFLSLPFINLTVASAASDDKPWRFEFVNKETRAICDKAESIAIPANDAPSIGEKASLNGCSSNDLYFGIGAAKNFLAARKCAYVQREQSSDADDSGNLRGPSVLMMIYANGFGVPKNLDLAIKFACETGGSAAELNGRIAHISALQKDPSGATLPGCEGKSTNLPFAYCHGEVDVCDDITSGYMMGVCAAIASDAHQQSELAKLNEAIRNWPPTHRAVFEKLRQTAKSYFENHARHEIDLSGTARGQFYIEERDKLEGEFRNRIVSFEEGRLPAYSAEQFSRADKSLNDTYAKTLKKRFSDLSQINGAGIRETQRSWLPYRDAWVEFAAIHYPELGSDSIKTLLTTERTNLLREIPSD